MTLDLRAQFFEREKMPEELSKELGRLGVLYARDIKSDLSDLTGLMAYHAKYACLLQSGDESVGFFTASDLALEKMFPDEKACYGSMAYLVPDFRASSGKHEGALQKAMGLVIDTLEEEGFDRINLFPPAIFRHEVLTTIGREKALRPYMIF